MGLEVAWWGDRGTRGEARDHLNWCEDITVVTGFWLSATSIKMNNLKHALMGRKNVMFVGLSISGILVGNILI